MRQTLVIALAVVLLASCEKREEAPPPGAVRIHTSIQGATLFVDAVERNPLSDAMQVELAPGPHMLEARRGGAVVGRAAVEARSALIYDVELIEIATPVAQPIAPSIAAPPPPNLPTSPGALSADEIQRVVRGNAGGVRACYEENVPEPPSVRILVELVILPDGSVGNVTTEGDDAAPLRSCIEAHVRTWTFPASGGPTSTSFPLVFAGAGDAPPTSSGSPTPSRADIVSAMNAVSPAVAACSSGEHGIANVRLVFESSGRVSTATVVGGSLSPPTASCIARAARQARVPAFTQPMFSVNYPFRI